MCIREAIRERTSSNASIGDVEVLVEQRGNHAA